MKHLITIKTAAHGTISCIHSGRDGQYAEAGTTIILDWQPSAGWGLEEAHYTDGQGNVVQIQLPVKSFVMPDSDIEVTGTFKRFVVGDWTGLGTKDNVLVVGEHGEAVPSNMANINPLTGETYLAKLKVQNDATVLRDVVASRDISAGRNMSTRNITATVKMTTPKLEAETADIGKDDPAQGLKLYDTNGLAYYVYVKTTGDGLEFVRV